MPVPRSTSSLACSPDAPLNTTARVDRMRRCLVMCPVVKSGLTVESLVVIPGSGTIRHRSTDSPRGTRKRTTLSGDAAYLANLKHSLSKGGQLPGTPVRGWFTDHCDLHLGQPTSDAAWTSIAQRAANVTPLRRPAWREGVRALIS